MTRTKKGRRPGQRRGRGRGVTVSNDGPDRGEPIDTKNETFEKYYRAQCILPESEWEEFMEALRQPLPSTFRVSGHRQTREELKFSLKEVHAPHLAAASFEGAALPVPTPLPWYPDELAWQINVEKKSLRKSPEYKQFHSFLVYETEVGNISRQEAVSMIPPLFLDVKPHHFVMDMCAAPGSKTSQILEALHTPPSTKNTDDASSSFNADASEPTGLLIANDSDYKRAQLLVHQSARLPSPTLMVTNLDASNLPIIRVPKSFYASESHSKHSTTPLRFHRMLADVPCSGDGTLRKNIAIWRTWNPMDGNGLHSLQVRILERAMRLLILNPDNVRSEGNVFVEKEKGRIVYSTCSFNPVENEAVIAAALNSITGYEVVDVSSQFPQLRRRPGLSKWLPAIDRTGDLSCAIYKEYLAKVTTESKSKNKEQDGRIQRNRLSETHWPPANASELGLDKCMRIYPHLQDTGGFFIAVLQRKQENFEVINAGATGSPRGDAPKRPAQDENETATAEPSTAPKKARLATDDFDPLISEPPPIETNDPLMDVDVVEKSEASQVEEVVGDVLAGKEKSSANANDAKVAGTFRENPYTFVQPDDPGLVECIKRLNLQKFPSSNLYSRSPLGESPRTLYLVNDTVKAVMQHTDYTRIRLVSAGVKMIGRSEFAKMVAKTPEEQIELQFRILSDGMLAVLPYVDRSSLVEADALALRPLLEMYFPPFATLKDPFKSNLDIRGLGSHIACFKAGNYEGTRLTHDLLLPIWKSEKAVSLMIDKIAKRALSLRLFGEDITQEGKKDAKGKEKNPAAGGRATPQADVLDEDSSIFKEEDKGNLNEDGDEAD